MADRPADLVERCSRAYFDAGSMADPRGIAAVLDEVDAWTREQDEAARRQAVEDTSFLGMSPAAVSLRPPPHIVAAMAGALAEMLGDARNYAETTISPSWSEESYVLRVERHPGGRTPHELRVEAEALRDQALARLAAVRHLADGWAEVPPGTSGAALAIAAVRADFAQHLLAVLNTTPEADRG